jgi:hypothetical protein
MRLLTLTLLVCVATNTVAQGTANERGSSTEKQTFSASRNLPTAREAIDSASHQRAWSLDDAYRLGRQPLNCNISTGEPARVVLVQDRGLFLFAAVRGAYGPMILANEWRVRGGNPEFAAFSFYRECALHALGRVTAESVERATYSQTTSMAADCLAYRQVLQQGLASKSSTSLEVAITMGLQDEFSGYRISPTQLKRCRDDDHLQELVEQVEREKSKSR